MSIALAGPHPPANAREPQPPPAIHAADLARHVHTRVNAARQAHGLAPLAWSRELAGIAGKHSHDMARRNYLAHDTPEGRSFSDRYRLGGYSCRIRRGNEILAGAENIALGRRYHSARTVNGVTHYDWNSVDSIARITVDGWMNSPGHRENILTPSWQQHGIGVEISPGNKIYITQNFC